MLLLALGFLASGCDLIGLGQATPTPFVVPTRPRPTPTPTPLPTPTPSAEVAPTPTRNLDEAQVQQLVFRKVRPCADQLSAIRGAVLQVFMETAYLPESQVWQSKVTSKDGTLFFGTWRVQDSLDAKESQPRPSDIPAREIDAENVVCAEAASRLSPGPLWPVAITPTPTPTTPPTATPLPATPTPTPASQITGEQAELRVWIAVYDCFPSQVEKPKRASFKVYVETPQRWFVEGKEETSVEVFVEKTVGETKQTYKEIQTKLVFYGLWTVGGISGQIQPWDDLAKNVSANQQCYKAQ